jgi:hypothetical protein
LQEAAEEDDSSAASSSSVSSEPYDEVDYPLGASAAEDFNRDLSHVPPPAPPAPGAAAAAAGRSLRSGGDNNKHIRDVVKATGVGTGGMNWVDCKSPARKISRVEREEEGGV